MTASFPQIFPPCTIHGNCGICDILDGIGFLFQFGLAVLGVAALVMFIIGAQALLGSRGNPEKVEHARKQMIGTIWGVLIVLAAWHIVNLIIFLLVPQGDDYPKKGSVLFNINPWNQICEDPKEPCFSKGNGALCVKENNTKGICVSGNCIVEKEKIVNIEGRQITIYANGSEADNSKVSGALKGSKEVEAGTGELDGCDFLRHGYSTFFGTRDLKQNVSLAPYRCVSDASAVKNAYKSDKEKKVECLDNLCHDAGNKCCGEVARTE